MALLAEKKFRWRFECPTCEFDHQEFGRLASDDEIHCFLCLQDNGAVVLVKRWHETDVITNA
jgi:hypothetical protein